MKPANQSDPIGQPLRIHVERQALTPAQMKAEVGHFVEGYIQTQLSTETVDEPQAEAFLRQAYAAVGLALPHYICWLDGPYQLIALLTSDTDWVTAEERKANIPETVWERIKNLDELDLSQDENSVLNGIDATITKGVRESAEADLPDSFKPHSSKSVWWSIYSSAGVGVRERVRDRVGRSIWRGLGGSSVSRSERHRIWDHVLDRAEYSRWYSIRAYDEAEELASLHFFDTYLAPNAAHGLAHFNQLVSGYWLGKEVALIVRRPKRLCLDEAGRLHCATGRAIEYHNGWGCYAWHGTLVDAKVILSPESLTRDDFLNEPNVEARRVIQERMGERFVWELGGSYIDGGPRGVLYEVTLPDDPERVARYVQVRDPSTGREYYLRVPPTIQTAAEAVAWTFGLSVEEYAPEQES